MYKVETHCKELFEGNVGSGIDFYWEPGSTTVLYQHWEHRASGREWGQVTPDPMAGKGVGDYILECWDEYKIVDVTKV